MKFDHFYKNLGGFRNFLKYFVDYLCVCVDMCMV